MWDLTGDWQRIMRSSVSAGAHVLFFFFTPLHRCQLYLEVKKKKFHDLYNHFLCVKEYLSDYYWQVIHIYSQLPVICSHTLQPREKGKKKENRSGEKPLKRRDNELKSLCASVSCSKPSRGEAIANEGKDSSQSQRDASCPASVEWQRAKWAWPLRRGNSITVCQSWGAARDRLLLHYKKKKKKRRAKWVAGRDRKLWHEGTRNLTPPEKNGSIMYFSWFLVMVLIVFRYEVVWCCAVSVTEMGVSYLNCD